MHEFKAMNTTMHTWGLPESAQAQVAAWFAYVEGKLSRFQSSSELNQMNRALGRPFFMSSLMAEVLQEAIKYNKETDGVFNPFLGRVLANLGYRKSFEQLHGEQESIAMDQPRMKTPAITLDPYMKCVTIEKDFEVDLGGIAKAWSASYLSRKLHKEGIKSGAIDAGGDIIAWGESPNGEWEMAIANPLKPAEDLVVIRHKQGFGIATSSSVKRHWMDQDGQRMHHLIDPRTNQPSQSDLIQVSVLASDLTTAEIYTKCVLILGSEAGIPWLEERRPDLAVIGVRQDLSLVYGGMISKYAIQGVNGHE